MMIARLVQRKQNAKFHVLLQADGKTILELLTLHIANHSPFMCAARSAYLAVHHARNSAMHVHLMQHAVQEMKFTQAVSDVTDTKRRAANR
ncbi:MAG: hypothetical protein KUG70_01995 [Rhodobacteraceae bacterium]|nr:hypothetical protein [Paracoccaceae bacterium]